MWRTVTFIVALSVSAPAVAVAQIPCTPDARKVVDELYRQILERSADSSSQGFVDQLASGRSTVRDVVHLMATSPEHNQRFIRTEVGEGTSYVRSVGTLYRHLLGRQPDSNGAESYARMAQQSGITAVIDSIMNSQEYQQKHGVNGVPGSGGMTYCGPGQSSSSVSTVDPNMRFRAMDRNGDGMIALNEWRGTRQAFNANDWNGDGVLSGEEVQAGAVRRGRRWEDCNTASSGFDGLDTNRNGRIEEREWRGALAAFDRLDRNNDGVLSIAEYGEDSVYNDRATATSGSQIVVDGRAEWTDSGIYVRTGDTLTVDAEGTVRLSASRGDWANPSGSNAGRRAADAPLPNSPAGGLVVRVGNSAPVYAGSHRTFRAPTSGTVYFGVNDDYLNDNSGQFRVSLSVQGR